MATTNNNTQSNTGDGISSNMSENSGAILQGSSNQTSGAVLEVEAASVAKTEGTSALNATTQFVDDSHVVERDVSMIEHIDNTFLDINDTQLTEQSLINFLEKPILFKTGTFATTDSYSFLDSMPMPYTAFQSAAGQVWRQKLAGFFGIRADMEFRIVVNANRFQQGAYMLGWVGMAGALRTTSDLKGLAINNMHMATLVQRTTVPHVTLDLASATTAVILVPFASVLNYYPLNAILASVDSGNLGYLNLYPYFPMVSPAGSTVAGYSIYCSLKNIKLFGAASAQSGLGRKAHSANDIQSHELSNTFNGPISGVAHAVAKGFKAFKDVPLLSSYATSIGWVADRVSNVASVFGFSKPNQGDSQVKFQLQVAPNQTTVDGDSDAKALSYLAKPGIVKLDGIGGTSYDEMDFSYICKKSAWFRTQPWATGAVPALLTSIPVTPYTGVNVTGGATHFTPVCFVSRFFKYWRGSLKFKIRFVKTEFHSGRLEFVFYPTDSSGSYTGNPAYANRTIVDIRDAVEVDFVIPYISRHMYTPAGTSIGVFNINILDTLVAPATVASTVQLLIEISGGDDMEFAVPQDFAVNPVMFVPQSGLVQKDDNIITATLGNSVVSSNPHLASSVSMGDKVSNFRAYLKRFSQIRMTNLETASTERLGSSRIFIYPDAIIIQGTTPTTDRPNSDLYSVIASCYAMLRGGMVVRNIIDKGMMVNTKIQVAGPSVMKACNFSFNGGSTAAKVIGAIADTTQEPINSHLAIQDITMNPVMTIEAPQYSNSFAKAKGDIAAIYNSSAIYEYNNSDLSSNSKNYIHFALPTDIGATNLIKGYAVHNVYRAVADDCSFSGFISIPPMVDPSFTDSPRTMGQF